MPLSPKQTRELLDQLRHQPNKKLGQNFLIDGNIVRKSVELAAIETGDTVVEIGPGLGTLSYALLEAGADVWAVERDPILFRHFKANNELRSSGFHLIEGDCLDKPLAGLPDHKPVDRFKIVANLPYAVSTPWMEALLTGPLPSRMVLMLQKEAGDRYTAESGTKAFGAISIFLQAAYGVQSRHVVSASCFYPAPKVSSVLLRLDLKEDPVLFPPEIRRCIRGFFTHRRKQLATLCRREAKPALQIWFENLLKKDYLKTVRPEEVRTEEWAELLKFW
ncbi:MAG: 16S rRNA (adenine(1518)-N(6)/adenine(1519)-N(6))-dimethyltransferase RsmA [Verrucomicrobiota bacterium]